MLKLFCQLNPQTNIPINIWSNLTTRSVAIHVLGVCYMITENASKCSLESEIKEPEEIFNLSHFSKIINRGDAFCLFHSLTLKKVYGGAILQSLFDQFSWPNKISDVRNHLQELYPKEIVWSAIEDLVNCGIIISDSNADLKLYLSRFAHGLQQYNIQNMYFLPTNVCNLRCKYCFIEDDERDIASSMMTEEIAKKGLEIFSKLSEKADKITLTFYGGEPLLNADVVYFSMHYVRELEKKGMFKKPVDMSLLTNGVLVDDRTIETVLETRTGVSVSMDGPEDLHNGARKDVSGEDTFKKVLAGYRKLQEAGINPGISCTISRFNVERLEDVARFICDELKPPGMGFNILLPTINGGNPVDVPHEHAAYKLIEAFKVLRERGIYEDRVMRRVTPYKEGGFHYKDCMGVGGQIVLTPDGKIGPCQAFLGIDQYFPLSVDALYPRLSSLNSDDIYKEPMFDEWRQRFPLNMAKCSDCHAIAVCGGGCPYASLANHGSIWEVDERICSQAKSILEWMIWDTFDNMMNENKNAKALIPSNKNDPIPPMENLR